MKKSLFILAAVITVGFASCKKDRICECSTTSTIPGSTANTDKTTLIKVTKSQGKANCVSAKWDDTYGGSTYTYTKTCTLK